MANAPRGREKNVTGQGNGVYRRGEGLGTGPVGGGSFMGSAPSGGNGGGAPQRSFGGGSRLRLIIIILVLFMAAGGGGLSTLFGGSGSDSYTDTNGAASGASSGIDLTGGGSSSSGGLSSAASILSMLTGSGQLSSVSGTSTGWTLENNTGKLNREVSSEARKRYTTIRGNGQDEVTIMVYMCGTDLESRSGMATNDLNEMAKATISDKVNIIVYTGGCKKWQNNVISSSNNQIYKVESGGLKLLEKNMGSASMTDPATLTEFIKYCGSNYPADRNMLIFWDHGGGSISGYGYDEKHATEGSMSLAGINTALKDGGLKYDFIGFDACLMATVETALMCGNYADYLIASEETEPGVGWYYTNWLTSLSKNTSMDTLDIGKNIVDDFVNVCARDCAGQKTTLSVVDLAELTQTVGDDFKAFSQSTTELVKNNDYKTVSNARNNSREFASSSKIDQIDLVNFAKNMGTSEGAQLAETLLGAVKYNKTSQNMTNAYGISIYFPYKKSSTVATAVKTYGQIGLDKEYSDCIREFTALQVSGQAATGGTSVSPLEILLGDSSSSSSGASSLGSIMDMISMFQSTSGGESSLTDIFSGRSLSNEATAQYIYDNRLDASNLSWNEDTDGRFYIPLSEEQWEYIHGIDLNMFYDDGEGYIDLGLDNLFEISDDGKLIADVDGTWLSIDNQPVAYYHTDTTEDGDNYTITGYVPALLNGDRVKLILIFDNENPYGYIAGADPEYEVSEDSLTLSRGLIELQPGDKVDFLCDYYSYDGTYNDSYKLGERWTVGDTVQISNTYVGGDYIALYKLTDIYEQSYFSEYVPVK